MVCGNGVLESGELCDTDIASGAGSCPSSCTDGDVCTTDTLSDAGTCQAQCSYPAIIGPADGDGCCPAAASGLDDIDCVGPTGVSCNDLTDICQGESCCTNLIVHGGTLPMGRSLNGMDKSDEAEAVPGLDDEKPEHDAAVADFYLDKYEVSVGRFRKFFDAYGGPAVPTGAGAHPLIAGSGWQSAWDSSLPATKTDLTNELECEASWQTWTPSAGGNESKAQNCVRWYTAFAFCAWDGGRLPTEAEWEYATAGGNENRLYAWGADIPLCSLVNYSGCPAEVDAVGSYPLGAARWGHSDLTGNLLEWTYDWYDANWYSGGGNTCSNCANSTPGVDRVVRGGHFRSLGLHIRAALRHHELPSSRQYFTGWRCARSVP